jgi:hypothetical protein
VLGRLHEGSALESLAVISAAPSTRETLSQVRSGDAYLRSELARSPHNIGNTLSEQTKEAPALLQQSCPDATRHGPRSAKVAVRLPASPPGPGVSQEPVRAMIDGPGLWRCRVAARRWGKYEGDGLAGENQGLRTNVRVITISRIRCDARMRVVIEEPRPRTAARYYVRRPRTCIGD